MFFLVNEPEELRVVFCCSLIKKSRGLQKWTSPAHVLGVGLEPTQPQWPRDFKSLVSTDSTIRAAGFVDKMRLTNFAVQR